MPLSSIRKAINGMIDKSYGTAKTINAYEETTMKESDQSKLKAQVKAGHAVVVGAYQTNPEHKKAQGHAYVLTYKSDTRKYELFDPMDYIEKEYSWDTLFKTGFNCPIFKTRQNAIIKTAVYVE